MKIKIKLLCLSLAATSVLMGCAVDPQVQAARQAEIAARAARPLELAQAIALVRERVPDQPTTFVLHKMFQMNGHDYLDPRIVRCPGIDMPRIQEKFEVTEQKGNWFKGKYASVNSCGGTTRMMIEGRRTDKEAYFYFTPTDPTVTNWSTNVYHASFENTLVLTIKQVFKSLNGQVLATVPPESDFKQWVGVTYFSDWEARMGVFVEQENRSAQRMRDEDAEWRREQRQTAAATAAGISQTINNAARGLAQDQARIAEANARLAEAARARQIAQSSPSASSRPSQAFSTNTQTNMPAAAPAAQPARQPVAEPSRVRDSGTYMPSRTASYEPSGAGKSAPGSTTPEKTATPSRGPAKAWCMKKKNGEFWCNGPLQNGGWGNTLKAALDMVDCPNGSGYTPTVGTGGQSFNCGRDLKQSEQAMPTYDPFYNRDKQ